MNAKERNRYIEHLMVQAQTKVRQECAAKQDARRNELEVKYNLEDRIAKIREEVFSIEAKLSEIAREFLVSEGIHPVDYWRTPLGITSLLGNMLSPQDFMINQFELFKTDKVLSSIQNFENDSIKQITATYNTVRENASSLSPASAEEYMRSLGFDIPEDEVKRAIMKPIDDRFLIVKGGEDK